MKKAIILFLIILSSAVNAQKMAGTRHGAIQRIASFQSAYVTPRNIDIWLPENYSPDKKYAVLYMHDGQMLFDSANTWNHQSWDVDDVLSKLLREDKIMEVIVVGVWNGEQTRHSDYFPQKPWESLSAGQKEFVTRKLHQADSALKSFRPNSDNYLKFLVTELKPVIDKKFSTHTDQAHTFIAGSSMGGLISMYAICEYPRVFGGAACLSTHWPGIFAVEGNPVPDSFLQYMRNHLPDPETHKIYFDYGDQTLDAIYPPLQKKVDEVMKTTGYTSENWKTLSFPGKDHSEKSWNERLDIPIKFLLKK